MRPRVSIVLLNYNYAAFLEDAIESVFSQTFDDWELVIADDGSTDDSVAIAARYEGERCRLLRGEHVGLELNVARSIAKCRGEFLAITSADDRWLECHLEIGVAALDTDGQAGLSYSLLRPIDASGRVIDLPETMRTPVFRSGWIDPFELLPGQFIPTQTTVFRRVAVDRVGGMDPSLHLLELDLILRIISSYPVVFTGQTTGEYRVHGDSLSSDSDRMLTGRLELYRKHLADAPRELQQRYESAAYLKTAYRELVRNPTRQSTAAARRHILAAVKRNPRSVANPLHIAMLASACCGPLYPLLHRAASSVVTRGRTKRMIQRALGLAGTSHHSFGATQRTRSTARQHVSGG